MNNNNIYSNCNNNFKNNNNHGANNTHHNTINKTYCPVPPANFAMCVLAADEPENKT